MARHFGVFPFSAILVAVPSLAQQAPLAMVTDLVGQATWEHGHPVRLLDEIAAEKPLFLGKGARLVLVRLTSGEELAFQGPGRFHFRADGTLQGARAIKRREHPVLANLRLKSSGMAQAAVVMRSTQKASLAFSPRGPVVLDPPVEFLWESLGTDASYQFKLFDSRGQLHLDQTQVQTSVSLSDRKPLLRNETYTWILEARLPDQAPRVFTGEFRVLDATRREQLEKARPKPEELFSERLVYAALLQDLQIRDEAAAAWKRLSQERPEDARLKTLAAR